MSSSGSSSNSERLTLRSAINVLSLVEQTVAPFLLAARERGIAVRVRPDASIPARIHLDGERLRAVLTELVEHALGRVRSGEVRIDLTAQCYDHVPKALRLLIAVVDSGSSIDHGTPFTQARAHVAELGGHLIVATEGGCNGGVIVDVPAEIAAPDAPLAPIPWAPNQLRSRRILIADEGAEMRALLAETLRRCGAEVVLLGKDDEALPVVTAAAENQMPFHAVVLDHRFVEGDARFVAQALRNGGFDGLVIIFTVDAESHQDPSGRAVDTLSESETSVTAHFQRPTGFNQVISELEIRLSALPESRRKGRIPSTPGGEGPIVTDARSPAHAVDHDPHQHHSRAHRSR